VIRKLEMKPKEEGEATPGDGITTALIRRIHVKVVRQYCNLRMGADEPPAKKKESTGRPETLSRQFYVRVRDRYMELLRSGTPDIPKVLAKEFGYSGHAPTVLIRPFR
jgi:hypothetical protein